MTTAKKFKKTTYKQHLKSLRWESTSPPDGTILFHLESVIFKESIRYIQSVESVYISVYNFFTGKYLDIISNNVMEKYRDISATNETIIIGGRIDHVSDIKTPVMGNLLSEDFFKACTKDIQNYIIGKNTDIFDSICNMFETKVYPGEEELYDPSIKMFITDGACYTDNLDLLMYGKDIIYQYDDGKWTCKKKDDMIAILGTTTKDLLYKCICYGFRYAHATDRKGKIDKDPKKSTRAIEMIRDTPFYDFYVKHF